MTTERIQKGKQGERIAVQFLEQKGYKILAQNYRTDLGEIDIVAQIKETICFVEVKTRFTRTKGSGLEAISPHKQRKLSQAALIYLKSHQCVSMNARFDVILIEIDPLGDHHITVVENAFPLASPYSY